MYSNEVGETLERAAQRRCGCSIPGSAQGQFGQGLEQPELVEDHGIGWVGPSDPPLLLFVHPQLFEDLGRWFVGEKGVLRLLLDRVEQRDQPDPQSAVSGPETHFLQRLKVFAAKNKPQKSPKKVKLPITNRWETRATARWSLFPPTPNSSCLGRPQIKRSPWDDQHQWWRTLFKVPKTDSPGWKPPTPRFTCP